MTATTRSVLRARTLILACATLLGSGLLAGCGDDGGTTPAPASGSMSSSATSAGAAASPGASAGLALDDAWVKAAPGGMTGVFGVLKNTSGSDITVTSATSTAAPTVELHEVAMVGGAMKMRPKEGGFVVPAGATHELRPGGDHIMLMGLLGPVTPGQSVSLTLTTASGTSVEATALGKEFAGGNETYAPGGSMPGRSTSGGSMSPGGVPTPSASSSS